MTELVLVLVIGIVLVGLFLFALLMGRPNQQGPSEAAGTLDAIVSLPGLGFKNAAMLFDNSDYQILRRETAFKSVAWHLRHDRRRLVLLWLKLLRKDLLSLWRFRRILANYGVSAGFAEELQVATTAIMGLVLLSCLRVIVAIAGPFALTGLLRSARADVEGLSLSCASLLRSVPATKWSEIEHAWNTGLSG